LAREYKKLNKNVAVLPNCVDPIDWRIPKRNEGNKVRIGIVGSVVYYNDFEIIKDFIKELSERDDVELVVFGLQSKETRWSNPDTETVLAEEYAYWDSLKLEHAPWVPAKDYANTLNNLRLDMMLIPRKDNYFNRCKSNLKFLEAAMCEVPVVASSFKNGPYEELNNTIGFKVKNRAEFRAMTEMLIDNRDLRRQMGINAKEYVLKHYSIKNNAHLWAEAYAKI
jgi:glycosyltransferase involved in cell wall biosynthesis